MRFFNTTGPCFADRHYMLPAERRLPELLPLVEQQLYFVVSQTAVAVHQIGKSTAMIGSGHRFGHRPPR